jgi:hypothetical protein
MKRKWFLSLLLLLAASVLVGIISASALGGYNLDWWTATGGGGTSTGGSYSLTGSIGQPNTGTSSGGTYTLNGGFWGGSGATSVVTFADVPASYWAYSYIERLYSAGITVGCGTSPLIYCPNNTVTRAEMAVFLLRSIHGSGYTPPLVGTSTGFSDVPITHWAAAWIKQLYAEGVTAGCGPGIYCPNASVTRAEMAIFLLRGEHGSTYAPPDVGVSTDFNDVAPTDFAAAWIKQLAAESITLGCGPSLYCPSATATRAEMAAFLVRTFSLP